VITVKTFVFNLFQENTYIIFDETKECAIIDPGCYNQPEVQKLNHFISAQNLKPVRLINTHGHVDHVLGIAKISKEYNLVPEFHSDEVYLLDNAIEHGLMFGFNVEPLPERINFFKENSPVKFGNSSLEVIHVPGHSKGSVALFSASDKIVFTGDVLFKDSIGRTDLEGGDYDILMNSIFKKILTLGDDVVVFPGHGPSTTIGIEKLNNPFLS
jgi:glyoxylase-like metal-dependent hydrolase (beta-lactamase superfamily II)